MFFDSHKILDQVSQKLRLHIEKNEKICIAVSGGVDSLFLALAIFSYFEVNRLAINECHIVIIDHKLRANSTRQALETEGVLRKYGFENVTVLTWKHAHIETGIEEQARKARYDLLHDFCENNSIYKLFLAHHLDDQIETFFMNVFRGSGTIGLGCMLEKHDKDGIFHIRPLLEIRKHQIIKFMQENNVYWMEDESNKDDKFTRNKIRMILDSIGMDDINASRIGNTIFSIQGVNSMIFSDINDILSSENIIKTSDKITIETRFFNSLHIQRKIYLIFQIYKEFRLANKPRFEQISDLINIIANITQDHKIVRKIFLSDLNIAISDNEISFSS
ncbi:tRNA(Ile)-lysidine synthase [Candidatus Deianiraea vastatrix]|uniref:tRNA(Ile)-lysidine synthase n=2 Tax=Candidatus Deianiraea vastatrix TaxID=2163644 RepID=A0A5B8XF37_9RICK|nr:tRNA(Ile)-lysidine synthase [Candidatus Deianiraea vastatrix]